MCDNHSHAFVPEHVSVEVAAPRKRLRIWEITGGLQCSIIGTCLNHDDLLKAAERCSITIAPSTSTYDVHSYFVSEASQDTASARHLNKVLERRYEGIVRKVGRCATAKCLEALWTAEFAAGRVSGAYWAFLSHTHVSDELRHRIFGEVHMLSHVLARSTHQTAVKASDYAGRITELEERVARQRQHHGEALAQRDEKIAQLERSLALVAAGRVETEARVTSDRSARSTRLLARRERAVLVARERARRAEGEAEALLQRVKRLELINRSLAADTLPAPSQDCPGAVACDALVQAGEIRRVLYLGGRTGAIEQLRQIAERAQTDFIHHDGGLEQGVGRIEPLVEGCDAVFCPIDCISHSACQRAKHLCRKLGKAFVPLRSSGATTFERALATLNTAVMSGGA